MRQTTVPNSGPKLKLIEAAERLIAERGFDAVSVRDITRAAGGNAAAVNYHFGSRDGLLRTVMSRHVGLVTTLRMARLDAWESGHGGAPTLGGLLAVVISPVIEHLLGLPLPGALAGRLLGRILSAPERFSDPDLAAFAACRERVGLAFGRCLPWLEGDQLEIRLRCLEGALLHLLADAELALAGATHPNAEAWADELQRFAVAGFSVDESREEAPGPVVPFARPGNTEGVGVAAEVEPGSENIKVWPEDDAVVPDEDVAVPNEDGAELEDDAAERDGDAVGLVAGESEAGESAAEEPVSEQPVVEEPVVEQPVVEQPVVEQPVEQEPAAEEPAPWGPAAEEEYVPWEPAAGESVAGDPTAKLGRKPRGRKSDDPSGPQVFFNFE